MSEQPTVCRDCKWFRNTKNWFDRLFLIRDALSEKCANFGVKVGGEEQFDPLTGEPGGSRRIYHVRKELHCDGFEAKQ